MIYGDMITTQTSVKEITINENFHIPQLLLEQLAIPSNSKDFIPTTQKAYL